MELLEKAKQKNIIVYLGTGSGKTFIAVMLMKHMRDLLGSDKKVVFLANNVALLEQQAQVIRDFTGLPTGSYCGGDGVDDWNKDMWKRELQKQSVMVFIHQVFLDALSHGFISMSSLALLVIDECHHAVGSHPYSKIMTEWYHPTKKEGRSVPKVLGLSASIVVKAVQKDKFRKEKLKLEKTLDAVVETADGILVEHFVKSAMEKITYFENGNGYFRKCQKEITNVIEKAKKELWNVKFKEMRDIELSQRDVNSKATSIDSLNKDFKSYKNDIFGNIEALLELGVYSLVAMETSLLENVDSKSQRGDIIWYNENVRESMDSITKKHLRTILKIARSQMLGFVGSEKEKILKFSGGKAVKLCEIIKAKGFDMTRDGAGEKNGMRCIIVVLFV